MQVMARRRYPGERSTMPGFAILIDDGEYVASALNSQHADMEAAVLSAVQTASLFATDTSAVLMGRRIIECEVQDRESRENRTFRVTVEAAYHTLPER